MHFDLDFWASQIYWILTFATLLVLLVVLLGRDRARRFPFFTASIAMLALMELAQQLLLPRLSRITSVLVFWPLSDLDVLIVLFVIVELARRAFRGLGKRGWIIGTLALLAVAATVLVFWGPWPPLSTLTATSELATIRLMEMFNDKVTLLTGVLTIELGVLVTLFGSRYEGGWRSHAQQIVIGLSTASMVQLTLRGTLQAIGMHTQIHTRVDYDRIMDLRDRLIHASNVLYIFVIVWWIACLWVDEPGAASTADHDPQPASGGEGSASWIAEVETSARKKPSISVLAFSRQGAGRSEILAKMAPRVTG